MQHTNVEKRTFTPRETRQGFKGKPVLVILVVSLFLAMAVWLAAEIWGESTAPATTETPPPPGPATSSQTVNPGAQGSQTFDNNPPSGATPPTEGVDRNPSTQAP